MMMPTFVAMVVMIMFMTGDAIVDERDGWERL